MYPQWKRLPRKTVTADLGDKLQSLDAIVSLLSAHPLRPHNFYYRSTNRSTALRLAICAYKAWIDAGQDPWDYKAMCKGKAKKTTTPNSNKKKGR